MALKLKKSAGVPVTRFVHGQIRVGNAARLQGDYPGAIVAYRVALEQDPALAHVWVQLGHVLKDAERLDEAVVAYQEAASRGGRHGADALLHLGHLEKGRGRPVDAARHLVRALEIDPSAAAPRAALDQLLFFARGAGEAQLGEMRSALAGKTVTGNRRTQHMDAAALVLDCTALVCALRDPVPAGDAVRRQAALVDAALAVLPDRVRLAHVHPDTGEWAELADEDHAGIRAVMAAGSRGGGVEGLRLANRILLASLTQEAFVFPKGGWILGLGAPAGGGDPSLPFVAVRNHGGARYAAVVDDLQPLVLPQFSSEERRATTTLWLLGLLGAADLIFAASNMVAADLVRIAVEAGLASPAERIVVVPAPASAAVTALDAVPAGAPYALVVGDPESAKGHLTALDAWLALGGRETIPNLPDLVLIGSARAHETSPILRRIRSSPILSRKVRFAEGMDAAARGTLHAGATMVLCPSLYEGSDEILAEARACGVPIIASDLPVLRAGGGDVLFVPPGDERALADAVEQRMREGSGKRACADAVPPPAGGIAAMVAVLDRRPFAAASSVCQQAVAGRWHPFTPIDGGIRPGVGTGAGFRSDTGWHVPLATGCWTRPQGGEMTIGLPDAGPWRLSVRLIGLPTRGTRWALDVEGRDPVSGTLDATARGWIVIDNLHAPQGAVRLFLKGRTSDMIAIVDRQGGQRLLPASLGVAGFHVCRQDDWPARETFLEMVALGDVGQLGAYA